MRWGEKVVFLDRELQEVACKSEVRGFFGGIAAAPASENVYGGPGPISGSMEV